MNKGAPFLPRIGKIDLHDAIVDEDDVWGRRIVPLDCPSSLFLLDHDINSDIDEIANQLSFKKLRQHSLVKTILDIPTSEKSLFSMLQEDDEEETLSPSTFEQLFDDFEIDVELPRSSSNIESRGTTNRKNRTKPTSGRILPEDFQPSPYSVIVGKGRESKNVVGNERLRALAASYLPRYAAASDERQIKSDLVSNLIATIRGCCPVGAFIKLGKDGRWYEVSDTVAREKVGYTFRDLLGDKYRSSSKAKAAMRSLKKKRFSHQWNGVQ